MTRLAITHLLIQPFLSSQVQQNLTISLLGLKAKPHSLLHPDSVFILAITDELVQLCYRKISADQRSNFSECIGGVYQGRRILRDICAYSDPNIQVLSRFCRVDDDDAPGWEGFIRLLLAGLDQDTKTSISTQHIKPNAQ
jgi:hypothetical protein